MRRIGMRSGERARACAPKGQDTNDSFEASGRDYVVTDVRIGDQREARASLKKVAFPRAKIGAKHHERMISVRVEIIVERASSTLR